MALESWIEFIRSSKHHVSVKLERWYGGTPENGGQNEDKWGVNPPKQGVRVPCQGP